MNGVLYNEDGSIYAVLFGGDEESLRHDAGLMDKPCILTEAAISKDEYYVRGGELVEIPEKPEGANVFDCQSGEWTFDISDEKSQKWQEIKLARDIEEYTSFVWSRFTFDANERSQQRITSAVQRAQLDTTMTVTWTMSDNSTSTFNATEVQQIGQALAAHVNACHVKAREKRALIEAATTKAQLDAISW